MYSGDKLLSSFCECCEVENTRMMDYLQVMYVHTRRIFR